MRRRRDQGRGARNTTARSAWAVPHVAGIPLHVIIRSGWAYRAARAALPVLRARGARPYQIAALECMLSDLSDAYLGNKPCIFTSAFVPTELVYGLGGVPFLPEAAAGLSAAFGLSNVGLSACETMWYSADLCSFHRAGLGGAAAGLMPRPSAVIASSHLCDGGKRSLFHISRLAGCPFYLIDVPYEPSDAGARWLTSQVKAIAMDLVRRVPGLSLAGLEQALESSREALEEYRRVCALRQRRPSPWLGSEALNYVIVFLWAWGSPSLARFYRALRAHLERACQKGDSPVRDERHRLLWLNLRPYYRTRVFRYIEEECRSSVVFEEYSLAYWAAPDPRRPFESLAAKMMSHFGWGPIRRRLEVVARLVDEYSADGVVQFAQWGCRQSNGGAAIIQRQLGGKSVPFLNLDGDGVDSRCGAEAQAITRLGAFIELLDARRGW